ncbi:hypothetical protein H0H81_001419 [Sphagnurus paluster]|uniref:Geranylgeranyl transferase type-2 subunit alpha n=1 Tax=Sphagnurus paluster TaxID=117069 RepID=A0A9P7GM95_9AGAR|nr:hypothetical protein H0H81_001419 [Sphagnurus paluster]
MAALRAHPKVYWIWNHRRWCLENTPRGPVSVVESESFGWKKANWDKELFVVEKMLDADPRNFHAWDYRRYVIASMPVPRPEKSELAYTSRKIEANISNFSAWHQRSKVLTSLLYLETDPGEDKDLVESEITAIQELLDEQPDSKCMFFIFNWYRIAIDVQLPRVYGVHRVL